MRQSIGFLSTLAIAAASLAAGPGAAQTGATDGGGENADIYVVGSPYRSEKPATWANMKSFPTMAQLFQDNYVRNGLDVVPKRPQPWQIAEKSDIFVRCVRHPEPVLLREVVDGPPNEATTRRAEAWLMGKNAPCYLGAQQQAAYGEAGLVNRGALIEHTLNTYAPDLQLSRDDLWAPGVQARFATVETARNRFRFPEDRQFFGFASCLVEAQPDIAVALTRSRLNSVGDRSLEGALVSRSQVCLRGARGVSFDPTYLRYFVAEAVYRWAVAVKGVPSLIPAQT